MIAFAIIILAGMAIAFGGQYTLAMGCVAGGAIWAAMFLKD